MIKDNIGTPVPNICPGCGHKQLDVKAMASDSMMASWLCKNCGAIGRLHEHPQITQGRKMAKNFEDVHCMDKRITILPCNVQIGILRELMHKNGEVYGG